jgi:hypothetical protein
LEVIVPEGRSNWFACFESERDGTMNANGSENRVCVFR